MKHIIVSIDYWVGQNLPGVASGVNQWAQQTDRMGGALAAPDSGQPVIELCERFYPSGIERRRARSI